MLVFLYLRLTFVQIDKNVFAYLAWIQMLLAETCLFMRQSLCLCFKLAEIGEVAKDLKEAMCI